MVPSENEMAIKENIKLEASMKDFKEEEESCDSFNMDIYYGYIFVNECL